MEVLSLKWNNHQTVFSLKICELRKKTAFTDATLACHGKFYQVHRLVLSTCSEYFSAIFNYTSCKNPVVVLKDISSRDLEFLLDYMYAGEVNVKQNELPSLISAAESLRIKGLAVSDEDTTDQSDQDSKPSDNDSENTGFQNPSKSPNMWEEKRQATHNTYYAKEPKNPENNSFVTPNIQNNYHKDTDSISQVKSPVSCRPTPFIKEEPNTELSHSSMESNADEPQGEPCTSQTDQIDNTKDEMVTNYDFFPNEMEFSQRISEPLNPNVQDEIHRPLSMDSAKTILHSPYLQLSHTDVMRNISRNNLGEEREREDKESDSILVKKDYICSYCGRAFSHRTNQLAHERIHTGEKPFRCLYCPFRSALKGNLKNHIFSRHHADWKSIKHLIFPTNTS